MKHWCNLLLSQSAVHQLLVENGLWWMRLKKRLHVNKMPGQACKLALDNWAPSCEPLTLKQWMDMEKPIRPQLGLTEGKTAEGKANRRST